MIRIARSTLVLAFLLVMSDASAQCDRWQQRVEYTMNVALDHRDHRFEGRTRLRYTNNSPDTLREVFFHLYFNAFQPGSEMDVRSRTIEDPDDRIGGRIAELEPHQVGRCIVTDLTQDGRAAVLTPMGTVLKVSLPRPLLPRRTTNFEFGFNGQVPVQIRRSGRDNAEQVAYSMVQWYPKLAEYDARGWHADPYVGREFFGVWGDFDVTLELDSAFTVAATGVLQNAHEIGHGYPSGKRRVERPGGDRLRWHFVAKDVHDFAWAADREFAHSITRVPDGPDLHFFYKDTPEYESVWRELPAYMVRNFEYMNANFGKYPWPQYSFVQGGDGGMEYPMLTLITGKRRLGSLVGVSVHESVHSWYYGVLASNEGRFAWMDEGFTEYAGSEVMQALFPGAGDPHAESIAGYQALVNSGHHEPPSIHADHFLTNKAYGATAYSFGEMFVHQLGAVVGEQSLKKGLRRYFDVCGFKHPEPIDFERVLEKGTGLELDWYFDEWINTTRKLDYAVSEVVGIGDSLRVTIKREGEMIMPVDVQLVFRDGTRRDHHIPLSLELGVKSPSSEAEAFTALRPWQWTDLTYTFTVPGSFGKLAGVVIDPKRRTADIDLTNNTVELPEGATGVVRP